MYKPTIRGLEALGLVICTEVPLVFVGAGSARGQPWYPFEAAEAANNVPSDTDRVAPSRAPTIAQNRRDRCLSRFAGCRVSRNARE
jgi:hypothetical protein